MGVAGTMGLALLTEAEYRRLHETGPFDQKTSSWLLTPESIRSLGEHCSAIIATAPCLFTTTARIPTTEFEGSGDC